MNRLLIKPSQRTTIFFYVIAHLITNIIIFFLFSELILSSVIDVMPFILNLEYQQEFLIILLSSLGLSITLIGAIFRGHSSFLKKLNHHIKDAIDKKKLIPNFKEYKQHDIKGELSRHINQCFSLFKGFDQIKTSRVSLEVASIKTVLNTISEPVIFINGDKVVTHINHQAEELFRLISGETIGEIISRHINNDSLVQYIQQSLSNAQKLTDITITIRENEQKKLTILPVQNKLGEISRIILIFQPLDIIDGAETDKLDQPETINKS